MREDPSTSEEEHIRIMLVQIEVERVKFIVRSYVRTRLFKVGSALLHVSFTVLEWALIFGVCCVVLCYRSNATLAS